MSDKDPIKDLFRDKLQSHEVMPSKAVWSSVSSSLGHSAASAAGAAAAAATGAAATQDSCGLPVCPHLLSPQPESALNLATPQAPARH